MIGIATLTLVFLSISYNVPVIVASNPSPTAQTQQGVYVGLQTTVNGTDINYWYGIPYAQQPIGNLRWKPPQPLEMSNGTKYAYSPNVCPQTNTYIFPMTESCLTLNVYSPTNASNLPVYVWIHGGSFTTGAGILYGACPFVSTSIINAVPVVVVTINYRLGLLGFLADEGLYDERSGNKNRSTTGNYGILDQIMALDWIKENIAGFNGDPTQITIGGESAGGASVTILLTSPLVISGTFQRAIIESGAIWPNVASNMEIAINSTGKVLRANFNCTMVQCLRDLAIQDILKVQAAIVSKNIFGVAANPVIDGYVLNDIMENYYARGDFQRVPVLLGSTTNETSTFTCPYFKEKASVAQVQAFFNILYNATIANEIPTIYGPISAYQNALTYLNIVYSDAWAHCGSRRLASKFSDYGLSAYLYTYNHLIPVTAACLGVAHAFELVMFFPDLLLFLFPGYKLTEFEKQLSTNMMRYWANFIHTSNPNDGSELTNWDTYSSSSDGDFVLDIASKMRSDYYDLRCSRFWDRYAVTNSSFIYREK
ncbi:unnamed protein product [Rotaria magnacalcarata]|uniref:Carboxylesterase type B domain-containing protein n=2 Tax=Rotaria magnacalcarata TaxID=392030 RepID=A0A816ZBW3_9BILA|nr:unnamed protein product [Rotaria magnacalcarata]